MVRPALLLAVASVLLGCGSIDEDEVEDAARATRKTVERGVDGARRGLEKTWDAAVEAYEERKRTKRREAGARSDDPLAGADEAIVCEVPGERCTVTQAYAAAARANGSALAEQVRVRPVRSPVVGMRIDGMRSSSIAEHLGFEAGDVVTHVNGIAVGSMRDTMLLYMNVRAARSFVVDYRRGTKERTLTLEVI